LYLCVKLKNEKMTSRQHLLVSIVFLLIITFEIIAFTSILTHPYMVGLLLLLGCVVVWNLSVAYIKTTKK